MIWIAHPDFRDSLEREARGHRPMPRSHACCLCITRIAEAETTAPQAVRSHQTNAPQPGRGDQQTPRRRGAGDEQTPRRRGVCKNHQRRSALAHSDHFDLDAALVFLTAMSVAAAKFFPAASTACLACTWAD